MKFNFENALVRKRERKKILKHFPDAKRNEIHLEAGDCKESQKLPEAFRPIFAQSPDTKMENLDASIAEKSGQDDRERRRYGVFFTYSFCCVGKKRCSIVSANSRASFRINDEVENALHRKRK